LRLRRSRKFRLGGRVPTKIAGASGIKATKAVDLEESQGEPMGSGPLDSGASRRVREDLPTGLPRGRPRNMDQPASRSRVESSLRKLVVLSSWGAVDGDDLQPAVTVAQPEWGMKRSLSSPTGQDLGR